MVSAKAPRHRAAAAICRLLAVGVLATLALPALLDGSWKQASLPLSFAAVALFAMIPRGISRPLEDTETALVLFLAASGLSALVGILFARGGDCAAFSSAALAYYGITAAVVLALWMLVRTRVARLLALNPVPMVKRPSLWVYAGLLLLLAAMFAVGSLVLAKGACAGGVSGRGAVILFSATFTACLTTAGLTAIHANRRAAASAD